MAKFDLSKIVKDLKIDEMVSNVKSMINPEGVNLEDVADDPVAKRVVELTILSKHLAQLNGEMSKQFNQMNKSLEGLLKELQAMKQPETKSESKDTEAKSEESVEEESKKSEEE